MASKARKAAGNTKRRIKRLVRDIRNRQPLQLKQTEHGYTLTWESYSYNPREFDNRVYLAILDGQNVDQIFECKKYGDDGVLEYTSDGETVHAAITSRPLVIEGTQLYFTKHNWVGTMALNRDTLMAGDVYNEDASRESKRKISADLIEGDDYDLGIEPDDYELSEDGEHYLVKSEVIGDVEALLGSKSTFKKTTETKLIDKLLEPPSRSKKKVLLYVAAGAGLGIYAYPYVMGSAIALLLMPRNRHLGRGKQVVNHER